MKNNQTKSLFVVYLLVLLVTVPFLAYSQSKDSQAKIIRQLEEKVNKLSNRIKVLEARITVLEGKSSGNSIETMRQLYIEANRDGIISNINNIARAAYQHRLRPTDMAGGGGSFIGFSIPKSFRETSVGVFTAEASADTVIISGESKEGLGTVYVKLDKNGKFSVYQFTGEFAKDD